MSDATTRSISLRQFWRDEIAKLGDDRGTGRTVKQMKAAPQKAVFIVPNRYVLDYCRDLAAKHGRTDLELVSAESLARGGQYRFAGRRLTGLVIDHACELSHEQWTALEHLWALVR